MIEKLDHKMMEAINAKYGFTDINLIGNAGGLSALNYVLTCDGDLFILKQFRFRNEEDIKYIEGITSFLYSHSFPVILPIKTNENSFRFEVDNYFFSFFPKVEGNILHEEGLTKKALESTALLLARMHRLATVCNLDLENTKNRILPLNAIEKKAEEIKALISKYPLDPYIDKISKELLDRKMNFLFNFISTSSFNHYLSRCDFVHGDFHNENLIFNKNKELAYVLDFEETHFGHRMEDVIQFIDLACCNTGYHPENFKKARIFLEAYSSQNFITEDELIFGIQLYLFGIVSSFFFENKLYTERDTSLVHFIKRDLDKLIYFETHMNDFVKELATYSLSVPKIKFTG